MKDNRDLRKKQEKQAQERYQRLVQERAPKSKTGMMCVRAFLIGGIICCIGQCIWDVGALWLHLGEEQLSSFTAIVLVFLGSLLTGLGWYDRLGSFAGAGSAVPITGFANAIVSPAMEHRTEGFIMGVGAKLFTIAGPVLVFGVSASILVGLLSMLFGQGGA